MSRDVFSIVWEYLVVHKYDGLFNGRLDCACLVADLEPCGAMGSECQAGHRAPCDCGDHDWHIVDKRAVTEDVRS